jgi:hypothetical protein
MSCILRADRHTLVTMKVINGFSYKLRKAWVMQVLCFQLVKHSVTDRTYLQDFKQASYRVIYQFDLRLI